jgi:hypothetical protein
MEGIAVDVEAFHMGIADLDAFVTRAKGVAVVPKRSGGARLQAGKVFRAGAV